jgi:membrane-bound serine protease (ClpP class)
MDFIMGIPSQSHYCHSQSELYSGGMKSMLLWFCLLMTTMPLFAEVATYSGKVVIIPVGEDDLISRGRFEFMSRTLKRCTDEGAQGVIFDLDTPGGLLWDTVELMMTDLQKLKPRSFAYVNPRALSAGAMIAVATDGIYMAPTSSAGAASPVYGSGQEMGEAERAKMNSATMGMARAVAKKKGHNPAVIEAMIDMAKELKVNGKVIDSKKEILTLDADQAIELVDGKPLFAKAIVKSLDDIKTAEKLTGASIIAEPTFFENLAIWVTAYASLIIIIGVAGGYLEMQAPGFGLPGCVSVAAFSLFFFGHYVAGSLVGQETAVAAGVFIIGLIFIILEVMVFPGTLVPGIIGFICVAVALVYTMSGWDVSIPALPSGESAPVSFSLSTYAVGLRNFAVGIIGAAVLVLAAARYLPETVPFRKMMLTTTAGGTLESTPAMAATRHVQVGDIGRSISALRPYGTVQFGDHRIEALVEGGYLQSGSSVRIREIQGARILVDEHLSGSGDA